MQQSLFFFVGSHKRNRPITINREPTSQKHQNWRPISRFLTRSDRKAKKCAKANEQLKAYCLDINTVLCCKKKNNVFVSQNILRGQIVDEKQFSSRQQEKKQEIFCKLQNCKIQININWGLEFSFEVEQLVLFLQKKSI